MHNWQLITAFCICAAAARVATESAVLVRLLVQFSGIAGCLFAVVTWLVR